MRHGGLVQQQQVALPQGEVEDGAGGSEVLHRAATPPLLPPTAPVQPGEANAIPAPDTVFTAEVGVLVTCWRGVCYLRGTLPA